ncbi:MAG: class I SAM-dependent methyltransferase [Spirochaetia bacterium]
MTNSVYTPRFWEREWRRYKKRSRLAQTQNASPEKWTDFYDTVSDIWLSLRGDPWELGNRVADLLINDGILRPESRLLDAGCGSGLISIPLAPHCKEITALDNSKGMLDQLCEHTEEKNIGNIEIVRAEWNDFIRTFEGPRYDAAVAAFFPPVFSPEGIGQLEDTADRSCLVMGGGEDPFPFRKELWDALVGRPLPDRCRSRQCAYNFLETAGKKPNIRHLSWTAALDMGLDDLVRFYTAYFTVFGIGGGRAHTIISDYLAGYAAGGRVQKTGTDHVTVIWWGKKS